MHMNSCTSLRLILLAIIIFNIAYVMLHRKGFYDKKKKEYVKRYSVEGMILGFCLGTFFSCLHLCRLISGVCLFMLAGTAIGLNFEKSENKETAVK